MPPTLEVHFQLEQDEDGYPPATVESVWAQAASTGGEYVLDSIPFFVRVATLGDTVTAEERDGNLWFDRVVKSSGHSLIRVVVFEDDQREGLAGALGALGCATEYLPQHRLVAVDVGPDVSLRAVQDFLAEKAAAGALDYEEVLLRQ